MGGGIGGGPGGGYGGGMGGGMPGGPGGQPAPPPDQVALMCHQLQGFSISGRKEAAYTLGRLGDPRAVPSLVHVLKHDNFKDVRVASAIALGEIGGSDAAVALERAAVYDHREDVKKAASTALERLNAKAKAAAALPAPPRRSRPRTQPSLPATLHAFAVPRSTCDRRIDIGRRRCLLGVVTASTRAHTTATPDAGHIRLECRCESLSRDWRVHPLFVGPTSSTGRLCRTMVGSDQTECGCGGPSGTAVMCEAIVRPLRGSSPASVREDLTP